MAKNKHGLYVEKPKKKEKLIMHGDMNEVPGALRKIDKKSQHNMNVLTNRKDISWSNSPVSTGIGGVDMSIFNK